MISVLISSQRNLNLITVLSNCITSSNYFWLSIIRSMISVLISGYWSIDIITTFSDNCWLGVICCYIMIWVGLFVFCLSGVRLLRGLLDNDLASSDCRLRLSIVIGSCVDFILELSWSLSWFVSSDFYFVSISINFMFNSVR